MMQRVSACGSLYYVLKTTCSGNGADATRPFWKCFVHQIRDLRPPQAGGSIRGRQTNPGPRSEAATERERTRQEEGAGDATR